MVTMDLPRYDRHEELVHEEPIYFVETLHCTADKFERLYQTVANFLDEDCAGIPGYVCAELLTDEDRRCMVIVTKWETREAWCLAQWNAKVGKLAEALTVGSTSIDYNLCFRRR